MSDGLALVTFACKWSHVAADVKTVKSTFNELFRRLVMERTTVGP